IKDEAVRSAEPLGIDVKTTAVAND
ncbi:MAG: hypothetical protein K0R01_3384, partial [Mycobacterium sp.]|nr:hypothetical protein [Mycobacterium sp.]